jgi:hypothetical protein
MRMFRQNRWRRELGCLNIKETSRAITLPTTRWHSPVKSNAAIIAPQARVVISDLGRSVRRAVTGTNSRLILGPFAACHIFLRKMSPNERV